MNSAFLFLLVGQIDVLESKDFNKELQVGAVVATVRVEQPRREQVGSGVLLLQKGPFAYVLTARHLVEGAEALELSFYSAATFPRPGPVVRDVEVLASSKESDLALVRATVRAPLPAGLRLAAEAPAETPFPALSVGCSDGLFPTLLLESVQSARRVRKPGTDEAVLMWELVREPAGGRSGGPLLDRQGRLIGMASGRSGGKGYCIHLDEIRRFLKRHRFDELLTEKSQP